MKNCPTNGLEKPGGSTTYVTPESSPKLGSPPFTGETYTLQDRTTLLDLRTPSSYTTGHLPGATNFPLSSLLETSLSPFSDPKTLELQWCELESLCTGEELQLLGGQTVIFVDSDGDTARVATSVFRARGVEAWSLRNGIKGLTRETGTGTAKEMEMDTHTVFADGVNERRPPARVGLGIGNTGADFLSLQ